MGDFNLGLQPDNRFMAQLGLGGGGNDLMNPSGLDFSSMMMMGDTSSFPGSAATGMIDFPDDLNSPKNSSNAAANGLNGSTATTSSLSTPANSTATPAAAEAIPFPAALANDPSPASAAPPLNPPTSTATTTATSMGLNSAFGGSGGLDLNGMSANLGLNMATMNAMNGGMAMGMNMGMNPTMNGFMPDMNMGMAAMNPMFMAGAYPMQQAQAGGMMMNMNPQFFQQQQQYMRLLQQRQLASMQQASMHMQQPNQAGMLQGQQAPVAHNAAQLHRQQMQAFQASMQNQQPMAFGNNAQSQQMQQSQLHGQAPAANARPQQPQPSTTVSAPPSSAATTPANATPSQTASASPAVTRQPWHSSADHALRQEMLNHIMRVLQSQKSNAPANWLQRLPEMARRLEEECYRISTSREEYANTSTLQTRLKSIVRAAHSQQRNRSNQSTPTQASSAAPPATVPTMAQASTPSSGPDLTIRQTAKANVPAPPQPIQMPPELMGSNAAVKMKLDPTQAIPMPPELQSDPVKTESPVMNRASMAADGSVQLQRPSADAGGPANAAATMAAVSQSRSAQFLRQFKARAQQVTSALEEKQTREYHNKLQSMTTSETTNSTSRSVLQRQQQRLLLLRHAMWCKAPDGTCVATPSCGEMKRLWHHMGNCQETTSCSYSHCISSKYVLSHFQQCENQKCSVCQLLRFPVEVKEKNGVLMMDADRALQQIQAATLRRQSVLSQSQNRGGVAQPQADTGTNSQPQIPQPLIPDATKTTTGLGVYFAQPQVTQTAMRMMPQNVVTPPQQAPAMPQSATNGAQAGQVGNVRGATISSQESLSGLTEEENRQLAAIQHRLQGVPLEQLNANCKKLESYAEQMRSQINAVMNECRQLLQMASSTQDPAMKSQFEAQVQTKKSSLHELNQRFRRYSSQHRIVKHHIASRVSGAPVASPPLAAPTHAQPNMTSSMQPIAMPTELQSTTQAPPQFAAQIGTQASNSAVPVTQPFGPQQSTAQPVGRVNGGKGIRLAPQSLQLPSSAQQQGMKSTDDLLGEDMAEPSSTIAIATGKPLEMPSDLQEKLPADPEPAATASIDVKLEEAPPAPASVKPEPTVNPLTMNNSKLNAMMMEHKRMDAAKVTTSTSAVSVNTTAAATVAPVPSPTSSTSGSDVPTSMLNELSNEDLKSHIESLTLHYNASMQPAVLKKRLEGVLRGMMEHKFGWVFSSPVDPVALGIPNYFKIIRRPMDLGTIKKKLDAGIYKHLDQFAEDVRLTFNNAKLFNSEDQDVYNLAKDMLNDFNGEIRMLEAQINEEEKAARAKESACRLCGMERMVFEPAVLYCQGECNSRIRRNCYYYCAPDNKYHCCQPCFTNLSESIKGNEGKSYKKSDLSKKKNDEVHEEPWVQCDKCNRWVHQVCALFNGKIDAEKKPQVVKSESAKATGPGGQSSHSISSTPGSEFLCPECLLDHRLKEPEKYPIGKHAFNAKDLMRTKLSDFLERRIYKALQQEREDEARWTNREVKDVPTAEHLTVRLVSNIEKQLMVRDRMFQRYRESHKYTFEHRFKSKCICMFQEIHGVSVLLFGMYVHEFDEQESECNSRRVYISYLDSVNYFEPSHLRTKVYHELLIAYLEFVRQRGFHTAHLWACPPLKGDDYILYCHPESQKTPKSDRLRQWYVDMLTKAQREGVVLHISNLYDEYWRNDNNACLLPYFEGDYWVGLAEEIIEKLDAEKPKKSKKGTKRKAGSEVKKPNKKSKSKKTKRRKTSSATSNGGSSGAENDADNGTGSDAEMDGGDDDEEELESADDHASAEDAKKERTITSLDDYDRTVSDPLMKKIGEVIEPMKDDFLVVKLQPYCRLCNKPVISGTLWKDPTTSTELGLNPKTVQVSLCDPCYQKAKSTTDNATLQHQLAPLQPETVTWPEKCTDPDDVNDSEYFDTRQAFLSLCQGNHYQFDELRRAKHSSMMALYHLGNPNPNAYVYECNSCTRDIVSGNRWHCHVCPDFDVCDACNAKEKHEHPLEKIPTSGVAGPGGHGGHGGAHGSLTEEQRRLREQRAKNVRLHMQLLVHASGCDGSCGSGNCEKMKELMRHGAQCKQRALGGCTVCRRVWALLQLHARQCRQYECKVPRCHDLREHVRKLQLQQQLMDDRRRAAVTQQYRQMQNGQSGGDNGGDDDPVNGM
ncbi:hypothetical protein PINS_up001458 [Pythium insidiosum]|nr:hypothetical protein PINS_up001458 [Pythium insidiosum]